VLARRHKYDEAEPFIREALSLARRLLGDTHLHTAENLVALADLLYGKGDYRGAEDAIQEAMRIFKRAMPDGSVSFSAPLIQFGLILNKTGRSAKAEKYLRQALQISTRGRSAQGIGAGMAEGALGECLTTQRRYGGAEPFLLRSYSTFKSAVGDQDPRTRKALERLVTLYESWGKAGDAARYQSVLTKP
jgi:tetratricopeptide (TPR) repeat protein